MDAESEVYKQQREVQNKYTYFLLAVAASTIALSLKRTTGLKITCSMIPLALAVLSWGVSFFCGIHYLKCVDVALGVNLQLITRRRGQGGQKTKTIQEGEGILKDYSDKGKSFSKWQFRLLVIGALFFISWHIIGMIKLTVNVTG